MPRHARSGPFAELDLADEFGPHPDGVGDIRRRYLDEGRGVLPSRVELGEEPLGLQLPDAAAHTSGVLEAVLARDADEQGADATGARADALAVAADHDLLRVRELQL